MLTRKQWILCTRYLTIYSICRVEKKSRHTAIILIAPVNFCTEACGDSSHTIFYNITMPPTHECRCIIFSTTNFSIFKSLLCYNECTLECSGAIGCRETFCSIEDMTNRIVTRFRECFVKSNTRSICLLERRYRTTIE